MIIMSPTRRVPTNKRPFQHCFPLMRLELMLALALVPPNQIAQGLVCHFLLELQPSASVETVEVPVTTKGFWMSLGVSGVTPVFVTRSSQEEKSKRPSSTNWLLAPEPDAREDPMPDRIGGASELQVVEKLGVTVLRSDSSSRRQSEAARR